MTPEHSHHGSVETVLEESYGRSVVTQSDPIEEYEYGFDDAFVRWSPWGDRPRSDEVWKVTNIIFKHKTTWLRDRDNPTTREDHRVYVLLNKETFDELHVPESDILSGEWRHIGEVDGIER